MPDRDLTSQLFLSSVQLNLLNDDRIPVGFASGCLIDYNGKRVLLTVAHATAKPGNWSVQERYVPGKGTKSYQLGSMHFLAKGSLATSTLEDVDFSYVEVPGTLQPYRQEVASKEVVTSEKPITVHKPTLEGRPQPSTTYGFCGMVLPTHENHFGDLHVGGEMRVYSGLTYSRTESDYHIFTLPFQHPGHEQFQGCSGAPVFSDSGELVGLVCKGCVERNEIWAISISAYKVALDILVGVL